MTNIGKSGVKAYQNQVNTSAHNIANSTTTAFKKNFAELKDLIYYEETATTPYYQGVGVRADDIVEDDIQGTLMSTGIETNYAISGEGYFGVFDEQSQQILLTRDGSFTTNADGILVDARGNRVLMKTMMNEQGEEYEVPQLYKPTQKVHLNKMNQNYYQVNANNLTSNAVTNNGFGEVKQGYLETSNVDMAEEMTSLMIAQRAYSMNMKVIQTADETSQVINNLR